MNTKTPTFAQAVAAQQAAATKQAEAAMQALRNLPGIDKVLEDLRLAQTATEAADCWDTTTGRKVEAAWGNLRAALEATGRTF